MPDIVITEFMDPDAVTDLASHFDVHYDSELGNQPSRIAQLVADARALIVRNKTAVSRDVLDAAPQLIAVGRLGVGLDNIDLDACAARDIAVFPVIGANAESVAEYVIGALLVLMRPALTNTPAVIAGRWPRQDSIGLEMAGKWLGLVGFGDIARRVAVKAGALGMLVAATDPFVAADDPAWELVESMQLGDLLARCDALSLHVPLVDETRHLIDGAALATMRPGAMIVNTSRGGIIDEVALATALRAGRLGGAALDVFEHEPLGEDSALAGAPNLIATPHIAGLTTESEHRVSALTAENIRRALTDNGS